MMRNGRGRTGRDERQGIVVVDRTAGRIGRRVTALTAHLLRPLKRRSKRAQGRPAKEHEIPCTVTVILTAYLYGCGLRDDPKGPLFRTVPNRRGVLSRNVMAQPDAYRMIGRRAAAAGIMTKAGNHSFRATGITAYLKNSGTLEKAASMANHASTRTTQLYDRRHDEINLDEVERIGI
jgi:integrase/recombinase XerC